MKLHELEQILSTITYKPGWKIVVNQTLERELLYLQIHATVTDAWSDLPARGQFFATTIPAPLISDAEQFIRWVRDSIIQFEMHEVDEYLRINGEWVNHPHPELRERFPRPPQKREMTGLASLIEYTNLEVRDKRSQGRVTVTSADGEQVAPAAERQ